ERRPAVDRGLPEHERRPDLVLRALELLVGDRLCLEALHLGAELLPQRLRGRPRHRRRPEPEAVRLHRTVGAVAGGRRAQAGPLNRSSGPSGRKAASPTTTALLGTEYVLEEAAISSGLTRAISTRQPMIGKP